jgi:hypothetical protein
VVEDHKAKDEVTDADLFVMDVEGGEAALGQWVAVRAPQARALLNPKVVEVAWVAHDQVEAR